MKARIGGQWSQERLALPQNFNGAAFHLIRVEVNARHVTLALDGTALRQAWMVSEQPDAVALVTSQCAAEFAGFALTEGWEDLFTQGESNPASLNWQTTADDERWRVSEDQLWYIGPHGEASILTKGPLPEAYELVVNARLAGDPQPGECYGFLPALSEDGTSPLLTVECHDSRWAVCYEMAAEKLMFPLPVGFDPFVSPQFRFRRQQNLLTIQHGAQPLGAIECQGKAKLMGLYGYRVVAAFDMVRVTAL